MNRVDFLPNDYRVHRADQRLHLGWFGALLVYVAVFGTIAFVQHTMMKSARSEHDGLRPLHEQAVLTNQRYQDLQERIQNINESARLHAYLQHPWPRTQVLAAVFEAVPESISFLDIRLRRTSKPSRRPLASINSAATPPAADQASLTRAVLSQLREEYDESPLVITVQGVTYDNGDLNQCIAMWDTSRLFQHAQLDSLDALEEGTRGSAAAFEVTLVLAPGYGQTGGPTGPSNDSIASMP